MDRCRHGGDWAAFQAQYGCAPLDFSANVSPLGLPEGVRRAACHALGESARYPDPSCRALRAALARHTSLPEEWIVCGNGASDLIWRVVCALRPRRALVTAPCFGEYEAALSQQSCELLRWPLGEGFCLGEGFLEAIRPGVDLLFLCQPNNPSGVSIPLELLLACAARCRAVGMRLVLDECFLDFLDAPECRSLLGHLADFPEVLVLRAFTKFYGMAGLRLGWAAGSDTALLEALRRAGPPWSVSHVAQAAGIAALEERDYAEALRALIARERPRLVRGLEVLGLRVVPGEANFLLFQSPRELEEPLRARGILLRCCGDYAGLDGSWYRCAVRGEADNGRLLSALKEVLYG